MATRTTAYFLIFATIFVASASAQVETANLEGPTITIDVERVAGPGSRPAIDPLTGGLTYIISITPDASFPVFTDPDAAGPSGLGSSLAVNLGFLVSGDGFSDAVSPPGPVVDGFSLPTDSDGLVVVNANSTPLTGTTATEPGDGVVDVAVPGPVFFGFETLGFGEDSAFTAGVQVGVDSSTGQDALFAGLGTTFIAASTIEEAPFELFRVRTAALDLSSPDALAPSLTLVVGSVAAQSVDLSTPPFTDVFTLPVTQSEIFTTADVVPEPAAGVLIAMACGSFVLTRMRRACGG